MSSSKVTSKAAEVIKVANEVSSGMTKFSGFKPLLNVSIAMPYETMTMPMTAIMLDTQTMAITLITLDNEDTRLIAKELRAKMMKIKSDANHAVVMFLA